MPLDPLSRKIRIVLAEKGLPTKLVEVRPWEDAALLAKHNPAMTAPVLIDEPPTGGEIAVSPAPVIAEYLEEAYVQPALLPATSAGRAEARRLSAWFDDKFDREVNDFLLREAADKRICRPGRPDPERLRRGAEALVWHFDYLAWLLEQRRWLAGEKMCLADITAAAHLSSIDYLDAAPWRDFPNVKDWYARMKSRPSFRPLLEERIDGVAPPRDYANPDF
ncbi:MAG: glutathione S-transferase family protein [Parvularculaceae bacterium]